MNKAGNTLDFLSDMPKPVLGAGAAAGAALSVGGSAWFMSKLMGGFGLSASAVALDGAAAALTAAAGTMAGGKVAGAVGAAGSAAVGAGATAAGGGLWAAGAATLPWIGGAAAVGGGLLTLRAAVDDAGYAGMTSGERLRKQRGGSMRHTYRRAWGYSDGMSGPEISPTMNYGTGAGGDKAISVNGTMSGDAKLEITASSELISIVGQARQVIKMAGALQGNGPGITGKSSPDAAAPNTGASGAW